jgi:hypothetical protein
MNGSGKVISNERFLSTRDELDRFLSRFEDAKFVLESTGIWEFIYEGIEEKGFEAVSKSLRHTSTRTTELYYARIRSETAFSQMRQAWEAPAVIIQSPRIEN